jgi:hypothetical protein
MAAAHATLTDMMKDQFASKEDLMELQKALTTATGSGEDLIPDIPEAM